MLLYVLLVSLLCFFTQSVFCGINQDLTNFFNQLGYANNVTASHAYQGQQAGYYTGGSLFLRDSVKNVEMASIELPTLRSGCGGIDLYTGGFSYINSNELKQLFQNIMSNSVGYAFLLGLDTLMPEGNNIMKYLHSVSSSINQMNINSCETAAGLVGSFWPKMHEAEQKVCEDIGTHQGIFSDYAAAHQGCTSGGQMARTLSRADGTYQTLVASTGNIAWRALSQDVLIHQDVELAELMMTLSGTVIFKSASNDHSPQQYRVLPSLAADLQLLKALLHGGTVRLYQCDRVSYDTCLNPTVHMQAIDSQNGLSAQVAHLLTGIVDKIFKQIPLDETEKGLLNSTRLPLYKILSVQAAFYGDSDLLSVTDYADLIALDIVSQYLEETFSVIQSRVAQLMYPEMMMRPFLLGINQARARIHEAIQTAYVQVNSTARIIQETKQLEQSLSDRWMQHRQEVS